MEAENYKQPTRPDQPLQNSETLTGKTIPVVEEQVSVDKKMVETGKVHVAKRVVEQETSVTLPLTEESYQVERVPVNKVVETPPAAMHYEGDTIVIPVLREVMVVQKHYEIIEEIRLTKQTNQQQQTQQVTLLKEEVDVRRTNTQTDSNERL